MSEKTYPFEQLALQLLTLATDALDALLAAVLLSGELRLVKVEVLFPLAEKADDVQRVVCGSCATELCLRWRAAGPRA